MSIYQNDRYVRIENIVGIEIIMFYDEYLKQYFFIG